ncbi:glycosyltransferase [bacterium]|nr:glycosyltransferase [bacterium]
MNGKTNTPKITVVTPSFNQGEFLEATIQSILGQQYPNLEYMIMDGGSTDQSVEIIKKYEPYLTHWVSEKDRGQTHAINKGFERSTGDILAWLNSDDLYCNHSLHIAAQVFKTHPEAGLYIGNGFMVDREGKVQRPYSRGVGFDRKALAKGQCYILQPSVFINRKAYDKIGHLDESLHYEMDVDYWLRISAEYDVVVINESLSAYRWYEEVKTNAGGIKRWIEIVDMRSKYTDMELPPGVLVELLLALKNLDIKRTTGLDLNEDIEALYKKAYKQTQGVLGLQHNIPLGKGIQFKPDMEYRFPASQETKIISKSGNGNGHVNSIKHTADEIKSLQKEKQNDENSATKVDLVLQATGSHAWGVGRGWENGAKKLGLHNGTFAPKAKWGAEDVHDDDGLLNYLESPNADYILLLGFDWHSQMLHNNPKWREVWNKSPIQKILYVQESILNSSKLYGNTAMADAAKSAASIVDAVVYTDISDKPFFAQLPVPSMWQPFGVDEKVFNNSIPYNDRSSKPFFRGKYTPFYTDKTYSQRRDMIEFLLKHDQINLVGYKDGPVSENDIAADFNQNKIALNFPSVFSNHPTRVYEALACGCALVTNRTGQNKVDELFHEGEHLLYYSNREELLDCLNRLENEDGLAETIATRGHKYVLDNFTLQHHLNKIINWMENFSAPDDPEDKNTSNDVFISENSLKPKIAIDGVIFQLQHHNPAGIYRVWQSLLNEIAKTEFRNQIVLLDRENTAPDFPGIEKISIKGYTYNNRDEDRISLGKICSEINIQSLVSTYFTTAENIPSGILIHDMIPEYIGIDLNKPEWLAKHHSIAHADYFFSVSHSSARHFQQYFPDYVEKPLMVIHNAVSDFFHQRSQQSVETFKEKYQLSRPYFLFCGHRGGYKNAELLLNALSNSQLSKDVDILFTGGKKELELEIRNFRNKLTIHHHILDDDELATAYSGASALVYPSKHEGFGLPILEAMACGCPVITCNNTSLPEVAEKAALYVDSENPLPLQHALEGVLDINVRNELQVLGLEQAAKFKWKKSAHQYITFMKQLLHEFVA